MPSFFSVSHHPSDRTESRAEQERTKVVGRIVGGIDEDFSLGAMKPTTTPARSARSHQSNLIMWTRSADD